MGRINRISISIKNTEFVHKDIYRNIGNLGSMVSYYSGDNNIFKDKNNNNLLCSNFMCLKQIKERFFTYDNLLYLHFCCYNCLLDAHPELINEE